LNNRVGAGQMQNLRYELEQELVQRRLLTTLVMAMGGMLFEMFILIGRKIV